MSMINEITAAVPRYKRPLRKGRGESSGHGKTSGRGTKGAGARVGGPYWKAGHEGGQTRPLPARSIVDEVEGPPAAATSPGSARSPRSGGSATIVMHLHGGSLPAPTSCRPA